MVLICSPLETEAAKVKSLSFWMWVLLILEKNRNKTRPAERPSIFFLFKGFFPLNFSFLSLFHFVLLSSSVFTFHSWNEKKDKGEKEKASSRPLEIKEKSFFFSFFFFLIFSFPRMELINFTPKTFFIATKSDLRKDNIFPKEMENFLIDAEKCTEISRVFGKLVFLVFLSLLASFLLFYFRLFSLFSRLFLIFFGSLLCSVASLVSFAFVSFFL